MAITSNVVKTKTQIDINVYNNGLMYSQSVYTVGMRLLKTIKFDSSGTTVKEIGTFNYNTAGVLASKHIVNGNGSLIEDINFNYTNGNLSTITHYNSIGVLTETDYISNGILTSIVMTKTVPVSIPVINAPIVTTPVINTPTVTVPVTHIWNNVYGHGEINMIKALSLVGSNITDVITTQQWGVQTAHFDDSTAGGYIGKGIVIANIDTGVDLNNKALTGNLSQHNWNFINNTANVQDDNGHGSFTSSQMISTNVGNGIVGGASGAQLMVLKAMDARGNGTPAKVAAAITYAVDHGADIINMSLNGVNAMPEIDTALAYAKNHNVLVAISSGNGMKVGPAAPANDARILDNVISVGGSMSLAIGLNYAASSNSAGGNTMYNYVVAPSVKIQGYNNVGAIITDQGTSMASAYTAAGMAVLESAYVKSNPTASADAVDSAVMSAITQGTDVIGLFGVYSLQLAAI